MNEEIALKSPKVKLRRFSLLYNVITTFRRVTTKNGTSYNSNEVTITVSIPPIVTPIPIPTSTKDYVLTTTYISASAINKVYDITYTDGFGRPQQEISIGATPTGKDIVKIYQYSLFGRVENEYLPYNATANTGAFQSSHNWNIYGADATTAFSKITYENSPQDRVLKQVGAGSAWHTADKGVSMSYAFNSANEVILWTVSDAGVLTNSGYYGVGTLSKVTMTNEDGAVSYEYKDNQDRVLLSIAMNGSDALKTYYVYDDFGLLRFVLTPEAVSKGATSYINEYCYTYKYDHRQRLIEKKLPGADPIFYKYDAKDRLVLSQDGNQRQRGVWSYTLYDSKNRSIEIGETTSTPPSTIGDSYDPSNKSALQYLYYDNYNYAGVQSFNATENISGVDKYLHVTGLQTGAKTKVLGTDSWIITTTYFDNKVRPIQVIADIYGVTGGKSIVGTKYDFVGNVLQTREKHENDVVVSTNTYDARGRLLTTSTSLNGSSPATMEYMYDELGRLSTKKYGNNTVSETYAYNVRGWLTEKNSSKFNMKLRYQNPAISGTTARYNGNITEWEWKQGANAAQAYTFTYDGISRLTDNKQYAQSGSNWTLNNSFVEQGLTYDQNGNIKSLQRNANGSLKDNFSYNYTGNQLLSLNSVSGNYLYDKNGNMTKDPRKNLDIEYNSLNLLSEVKQGGASKAKYIYAADGTKLGVVDAGGNGYDYRGSLIYKSTYRVKSLESAAFSDGRIIKSTSSYTPNYNITDHLGSVRVVFDGSGNVVETNDYYAFGGRHADGSSTISNNRFKFNGKEEQTTGNLGFLDYGSRMNDPELGRWFVQDPAEQFSSPYNFCGNNPIRLVDPNGEWATIYEDEFGNELFNTNDGSNAIITVSNERKGDFLKNLLWTLAAGGGMVDSRGWNRYWKEELTGLKWDSKLENWVNSLNSKNSIKYGIQYLQGIEGAGFKFLASEIGGLWTNPYILTSMASAYIGGVQAIEKGALKHYFKNTQYSNKVQSQTSNISDKSHSFPYLVENYSQSGKVTRILGNDGIYRQKLAIPGFYNGRVGNFEYIREPNGLINHKFFNKNK